MTSASPKSRGSLVVLSAPSGAGKTTLVHELIRRRPGIRFSISYTTRPPRESEKDGEDYFFVSEDEFQEMVARDAFLESATVFDHSYGTSRDYVGALVEKGETVLLEIDWQGAAQVRSRDPSAVTVFILPPSRQELERRLRGRATDSEETIARRLGDALSDMAHWSEFDYVVVNDDVSKAADELEAVLDGHGEAHAVDAPAVGDTARSILAAG